MKPPTHRRHRWPGLWSGALLLVLAAGCATGPPASPYRRALRRIPHVPEGHRRADQALIAAFFAANGIPLSIPQAEEIIPYSAPRGRMARNVLRNMARKNNRIAMVVKADETYLWDALAQNTPLLILLPPDIRYHPFASPLIPVAWDKSSNTIDLLDGNSEIQTMAADDFFSRREPLKQAALVLIRPDVLSRSKPTREQKLLLADFWFHQGFYQRADAVYSAIQEDAAPDGTDVDALTGHGNVLVRKGRYREAIPVFRAALALDPDNPKILNNLAYTMLHGDAELMPALRHANKAVLLDPHNPLVLETVGSINLRIGDPFTAAKYLERAWARALRRSHEVQIAIMDQLVRAWLGAHREDLAWQVADYRHRTYPDYRFPKDISGYFPTLLRAPAPLPGKSAFLEASAR